jgi:hypothetical protein
VQTIRTLVEGFLRGRYSLAELLNELVRQAFRGLAGPVLIGALLVTGYLLLGPLLTIPRFTTEGPVVRNGVAVVVVCGKKSGGAGSTDPFMSRQNLRGMEAAMEYVPEAGTGWWWPVRSEASDCTTWYHSPPGPEQRLNRQERASFAAEGVQRSPSQFQRLPILEKLPQSP